MAIISTVLCLTLCSRSYDLSVTSWYSVLIFTFRRLRLHKGNKADQYKKKIAKLETDLRVLQEGGPLYGGYGGGLRGKIEGSIRGMSL